MGTHNTSGQIHGGDSGTESIRDVTSFGGGDVSTWMIVIGIIVMFLRSVPPTSEDAAIFQPCKEKWGLTTKQILQWANK